METPTLEEVGKAVHELRSTIENKGMIDKDKLEKLNLVLDAHEEKSQKITQLEAQAVQHAADVAEYKQALEKSGATQTEIKTRIDELEAELARASHSQDEPNYKDGEEYKAMNTFCKVGVGELEVEQKQLLRTDSMVSGGFLVPSEMDTQITKKIVEIDGIRAVARVRTIAAKSIEIPIRNTIPVATYEGEAEQGGDSTSLYENETVTPFRQTFTTPLTQDMLMDAAFDMESEIVDDASEAFAFGEGNGFVVGSGFKQPAGIFTNAVLQAAARDTAAAGALDADAVILLTGDLKVGYNPVYVLNRRTLALIRTFKSTTGQFLWQPGLNGPVANTINGFPYILANSVPDVANGAFAIGFGDFRRGYTIVDRTGISVIRDELTQKKKAIVEFTWNRWNTGRVTLPEAIKLLRIAP